ncbi:MAG: hypothetical protein WCY36_07810 [Candidatus Omnitrophota bacterium]
MKLVFMAFILVVFAAAIVPISCYAQNMYDSSDEDLRVFDGRVVNVNLSQSILTVKGIVQIDFPISPDTSLQSDIYDIELSDIDVGDYVTVQYYRSGSESRSPMKVLTVTVENKPED